MGGVLDVTRTEGGAGTPRYLELITVGTYLWAGVPQNLSVVKGGDNRLIRSVMLEAMEMRDKVKWLRDLKHSLGELGWKGVSVEA